METYNQRKVNLRGIFQLDQMEDFLSRLLDRIDKQDEIIRDLQLKAQDSVTKSLFSEQFNTLNHELSSMSKRLDVIESAIHVNIGNQMISAGELALQNHINISSIQESTQSFIHRSEVNKIAETLIENSRQDIKKLYDWATPLDLTSKLQQLQLDVTSRLKNAENMLNLKLDRSEAGSLEVLATRLHAYDSFKNETESSLSHLQISTDRLNSMTAKHVIELTRNKEELIRIEKSMALLAPISELSTTNKQLNVNTDLIKSLNRALTEMIQEKIQSCEVGIRDINIQMTRWEESLQAFDTALNSKASIAEVKQCVVRKHYEEAVTHLGTAIDSKATVMELETANSRIKSLEEDLMAEQKKVAVAMRFVDWFVERGASYEHNMQVLDKHISNLAKSNHPSTRQPFTGQIQYAPIMEDFKERYHKLEADSGRPINEWNAFKK